MSYVRMGKSGRLGRVARVNKISRLGRGGLQGRIWSTLGFMGALTPAQRSILRQGLRSLAQDSQAELAAAWNTPDTPLTLNPDTGVPFGTTNTSGAGYGTSPSGVPGGLTTADANVISAAINAAGKVGTQAIIGTPSLTYNPLTGTYTATGGAAIPSSLGLSTAISQYLPLILLGGAAILLVSVIGKR